MVQCLPPDICYLCLSRDRKIFCLSANIRHLFGFLTNYYPQTEARVCWECRATLERLHRFKAQAERAVWTLERARTGLQPMSFECLSKVYSTQVLFIDLLESDVANATDDFSINANKKKTRNDYKVEVEFEDTKPEIKVEIAKEDLSENIIYENVPDHISEDGNDVGTKPFVTIDLTEDDIEYATESDTEQINVPQTELQIVVPSSSAEGEITSKNVKNSRAIKKRQGIVKPKIKREKPIFPKIRRKFTTAKQPIDKESRAEEMKFELYQKGKAFECDLCGKKLKDRGCILRHMRMHFKKLMCDQCAFKCSDQSSLKLHMLAHLDPSHRPHGCEVCNKRFINKYKLLVHTRSHTGERLFKCDNCDMAFTCKEALTCHIKKRHTDRSTVERKISQSRTKSSYRNACHGNSFTRVFVSNTRVSNRKTNYKVIKHNENVAYECNVCKEIFEEIKTFYKHYYSTHKITPCAECDKTFNWEWQLRQHVSFVHRGERPHQCNVCGATSPTKGALRVHISTHSNEKRFKCDECSVTFKSHSGLWSHKMVHKGEKPHQCDICDARFTLKGNLMGHMKVHTNDRPFECDICGKKFPWKRNLKNHLKTHSKD